MSEKWYNKVKQSAVTSAPVVKGRTRERYNSNLRD